MTLRSIRDYAIITQRLFMWIVNAPFVYLNRLFFWGEIISLHILNSNFKTKLT